MKQPELGNKIAQQRKHKGMTQEELAIQCNITARSIQRIEAGEVFPRSFTLKKLSEVLDFIYEDLENTTNTTKEIYRTRKVTETSKFLFEISAESIIRIAIISGLLNLFFAFAEVVISYIQYKHYTASNALSLMSVFVYFASFITCVVYLCGLLVIGKLNKNIFLLIGTLSFMLIMVLVKGDDVISASNSFLKSYLNSDVRYFMFGSAILMNGVGILLLRTKYGLTTKISGVLDCLNGLLFLLRVPFPIGLIALAIARITETIMMHHVSIIISNKEGNFQ